MSNEYSHTLGPDDVKNYRLWFWWNVGSALLATATLLWTAWNALRNHTPGPPIIYIILAVTLTLTRIAAPTRFKEVGEDGAEVKARRRLVGKWIRITDYGIKHLPTDAGELELVRGDIEAALRAYAIASTSAFTAREKARLAFSVEKSAASRNLRELPDTRRKLARFTSAFLAKSNEAERQHKKFLEAWDYLVRDTHLLRHLEGKSPDAWREGESAHLRN